MKRLVINNIYILSRNIISVTIYIENTCNKKPHYLQYFNGSFSYLLPGYHFTSNKYLNDNYILNIFFYFILFIYLFSLFLITVSIFLDVGLLIFGLRFTCVRRFSYVRHRYTNSNIAVP